MKTLLVVKCAFVCATLCALLVSSPAQDVYSPYLVGNGDHYVHIMPTIDEKARIDATLPPSQPLLYHGGPVMITQNLYAIFWLPKTLQDGSPTSMSAKYQPVIKQFLGDYPAHGIKNNSTQYYQGSTTKTYIKNVGAFTAFYVDTNPYPASECFDGVTGSNCITDAQLEAEVTRVMGVEGWKPSSTNMFLVFTSSGEGSCFDSSSTSCSYTQYCAYHSAFGTVSAPTIYGNEPYLNQPGCFSGLYPNGDSSADSAVSVASHEITEANTDPELNAWYDASGNEIGDICNFNFGTATWDGGKANQTWNGHFYYMQQEYDNHTSSCVQVGP